MPLNQIIKFWTFFLNLLRFKNDWLLTSSCWIAMTSLRANKKRKIKLNIHSKKFRAPAEVFVNYCSREREASLAIIQKASSGFSKTSLLKLVFIFLELFMWIFLNERNAGKYPVFSLLWKFHLKRSPILRNFWKMRKSSSFLKPIRVTDIPTNIF